MTSTECWPSLYALEEISQQDTKLFAGLYSRIKPPRFASERGRTDAKAAWHRWADTSLFESHQFPSKLSLECRAAIERARCEVLSSFHLTGMMINLANHSELAPSEDPIRMVYLYARSMLEDCSEQDRKVDLHDSMAVHKWLEGCLFENTDFLQNICRAHLLPHLNLMDCLHETILGETKIEDSDSQAEDAWASTDDDGLKQTDTRKLEALATEAAANESVNLIRHSPYANYTVFSKSLDREVRAERLFREMQLDSKRASGPKKTMRSAALKHLHQAVVRLCYRHWQFDLPQGQIDPRRLAKLVSTNPPYNVFRKQVKETDDIAISLLVDQSGSMKGQAQELTVMSVKLIGQQLQRMAIPFEVLSFTTRFSGRDGISNPISESWRQQGMPSVPGRLNALHHIIIKNFCESWFATEQYMDIVLEPSLGNENIDGEALHWAASRLSRRPERKKLMIILSDATPRDPQTDSANPPLFLENHLRAVIDEIDRSSVCLSCLGFGRNVVNFYTRAERIQEEDKLPDKVFDALAKLLNATAKDA